MKLNNEVWAFIPARSGSKTIKDKNLVIFKKKPLIAHSIIVAKNCNKIDNLTDTEISNSLRRSIKELQQWKIST